MLILLLIVFFENGLSLVVIQIKSSFIIMFVFGCKINTFCYKSKTQTNILFYFYCLCFSLFLVYSHILTIWNINMILTEQLVSFIKIFRVKCFFKAHLFYQIVLILNKKITKRLNLRHRNIIMKNCTKQNVFEWYKLISIQHSLQKKAWGSS